MSTINVHIGSLNDMGHRFANAWHRAEKGGAVDETHLTFYSLETLLATLTPKRMDILKEVHRIGNITTLALAENLKRDHTDVQSDVSALFNAGLLMEENNEVMAPWDEITASLML